ncbi:MAG TPA: TIGR03086 family metal-binding protein [Acidimicrobiales bacterium]|nr:TIGR03086 family metal-binding protein [Acidimicrobiales bacterium]
MSEVLDRYRELADAFSARVDAVSDEKWSATAPCEGWVARDVVAHVVNGERGMVLGEQDALPDGVDLKTAWKETRAKVEALAADPAKMAEVVETPLGSMPREQLVGSLVSMDLLVHTWDLARAIGADERLHPEAVAAAYETLKPMDAMIRMPGVFGPKITPPAGADLQTEFLSFTGRKV